MTEQERKEFYQNSIKEQYDAFDDEEKAFVIKTIKKTLSTYIISSDEKMQSIYLLWVEKQKRGITRFLHVVEEFGERHVKVVTMDVAMQYFSDYMQRCQENGIDPTSNKPRGRKPKYVTI